MMEVAIIGSDMQAVIGTAFGIYMISGQTVPVWAGVLITLADGVTFLVLDNYGLERLEVFFGLLVAVMAATFGAEYFIAGPAQGRVVKGLIVSWCEDCGSRELITAVGLIGASTQPHNLYLHSALVRHGFKSSMRACL